MWSIILGISFKSFVVKRSNGKTVGEDVGQHVLFVLSGAKACLHTDRNNPGMGRY